MDYVDEHAALHGDLLAELVQLDLNLGAPAALLLGAAEKGVEHGKKGLRFVEGKGTAHNTAFAAEKEVNPAIHP